MHMVQIQPLPMGSVNALFTQTAAFDSFSVCSLPEPSALNLPEPSALKHAVAYSNQTQDTALQHPVTRILHTRFHNNERKTANAALSSDTCYTACLHRSSSHRLPGRDCICGYSGVPHCDLPSTAHVQIHDT